MFNAERAFDLGIEQEKQCDAVCVDCFYQAATLAWPAVERQVIQCGKPTGRAAEIYRKSLCKLIENGQRYCRFSPSRGLDLETTGGPATIPIEHRGFNWRPDEFDCLLPVSQTSTKKLNTWYRCDGLGVAVIAFHDRRPGEKFRSEQTAFPATIVLRPVAGSDGTIASQFEFVLADPLRVFEINLGASKVALKRDLSASLAYRLAEKSDDPFKSFVQPGSTNANLGLFMIEPYQPGKIPVLFVHGLLSNPLTWANAANELRARPDLLARYQIWGFEYATGKPFLTSAAYLREQLQSIQRHLDPTGSDPALSQVILVGHSMGGLVAKLQITHSGTNLWSAVCCRPFEEISTTPEGRNKLAEAFFFEPSPSVARVVFMGTPHRGSPWAKRPIGRFGAKLVEEPPSMEEMHAQLIRDYPGIFSREFERRIPTSIDLLRADSPLLQSIDRLPLDQRVQTHSIIGNGYWMLGAGDSDKVVPVSSARIASVDSEKFIHSKHSNVNDDPQAIKELFCILEQHMSCIIPRTNSVPAAGFHSGD